MIEEGRGCCGISGADCGRFCPLLTGADWPWWPVACSDNCCQMSRGRSRNVRGVSSSLLTSAQRTRFSTCLALPGNSTCVSAAIKSGSADRCPVGFSN